MPPLLQLPARQMEWAAANIALNLDYIPDDKLNWKPAPHAYSALEIVDHLLGVLHRMTPLVGGFNAPSETSQSVMGRDDAKARLIAAAAEYNAMLEETPADKWDELVPTKMGTMPRRVLAVMPVNDIIHHNGQLAYIQLLLGDLETHRDMSALLK